MRLRSAISHKLLVGLVLVLIGSTFAVGQTTKPQTKPAQEGEALTERQSSLFLQLSDAEANIRAINQALTRTGYKVGQAYSRIETSAKNIELMDRKGGGPVSWQDFYGRTARSFVTHDVGSASRPLPRPKQFDYIYKANDQQATDARKQIASLAQNQFELLARRQKHESAQSPAPANQWFTMEVICEDAKISIFVDGKKTAEWTDSQRRHMHGSIAVQAPGTAVKFRSIQVMELPATK